MNYYVIVHKRNGNMITNGPQLPIFYYKKEARKYAERFSTVEVKKVKAKVMRELLKDFEAFRNEAVRFAEWVEGNARANYDILTKGIANWTTMGEDLRIKVFTTRQLYEQFKSIQ
jgi:hypothetical protein